MNEDGDVEDDTFLWVEKRLGLIELLMYKISQTTGFQDLIITLRSIYLPLKYAPYLLVCIQILAARMAKPYSAGVFCIHQCCMHFAFQSPSLGLCLSISKPCRSQSSGYFSLTPLKSKHFVNCQRGGKSIGFNQICKAASCWLQIYMQGRILFDLDTYICKAASCWIWIYARLANRNK